MPVCELCNSAAGVVLYHNNFLRIVLAQNETDYPATCRVIWQEHIAEMSDLSQAQRNYFMAYVWQVEQALRTILRPDKINLACLGNQVPHLHWHIIPRFYDDAHFPHAIWGVKQRVGVKHCPANLIFALTEKFAHISVIS